MDELHLRTIVKCGPDDREAMRSIVRAAIDTIACIVSLSLSARIPRLELRYDRSSTERSWIWRSDVASRIVSYPSIRLT